MAWDATAKKWPRFFQVHVVLPGQAQVGLVHERGGLQAVMRTFAASMVRRQLAQLAVDHGEEAIASLGRSVAPRSQKLRHLPLGRLSHFELGALNLHPIAELRGPLLP
jgi:hypothetical protein